MKKLHLLFTACFVLCISLQAFSQVRFGIKTGLNTSNMKSFFEKESSTLTYTSKRGIALGGVAEIYVSESFSFVGELLYTSKGAMDTETEYDYDYYWEGKVSLQYLELPLKARYNIVLPSTDKYSFFGEGGFFAGYLSSMKNKWKEREGGTTSSGEGKIDIDLISRLETGIKIGAGGKLNLNNENCIVLGLEYSLGFPWKEWGEVTKYDDNYKTYVEKELYSKNSNNVFCISLAYMF